MSRQTYWDKIIEYNSLAYYYAGTCLEYILPETHKRLYGISFTNLPLELGGKLKNL